MAAAAQSGLSLGGKLFFGGLTGSTFVLGCWQTQRYFEKIELMEERNHQLEMEATTDWQSTVDPYRRRLLTGTLMHNKEVLIGPRGSPIVPGQQQGGMGPSPHGFYVLTPMKLEDGELVWVNRGWVPKAMVPDENDKGAQLRPHPQLNQWNRPTGPVDIVAIHSKIEKPKITIEHNYAKRPLQLFWMDRVALQAIAESDKEAVLFTQIHQDDQVQFPMKPWLETLAEFYTTPVVHVGYATTWYGLAAAGVYMTRKLITRGR